MADKEIDFDTLSDEDFVELLESAENPEPEEEEKEEEATIEDTDQSEESEEETTEETETNDLTDDDDLETEETEEETEEEAEEENTQVDEDNKSEEDESSDDQTETEETSETQEPEDKETETINYQKQYEDLLKESKSLQVFHDEVTSEFTANGRTMKGFDDPKKIIQSMQMAAGFSDKMAGFKPYRPFMGALKERGMLDSPEKFNLAMNLLDGDPEALKQHLKNLEIDPFEMDMENINYKGKNEVSTDLEVAYSDILENAKASKVDSKIQDIISKEWDDQSVIGLLEDPQSSADLINHLSTGAYDVVQERIADKKRTDVNNIYSSKPMIQQYREAAYEIETEYINHMKSQKNIETDKISQVDETLVQDEKEKIVSQRKEEEYRTKVEKQNAKASEARKKATSVSKKKPRTKTTKKVFDPVNASDEDFTNFLDKQIYG